VKTLGEWLQDGPFEIALSSAFFGFFAHAGVVAALEESGFRPNKASGASAGALVAAALASGLEAAEMRAIFAELQKGDFWDPGPGLGLLRGKKFLALMARHFAPTFEKTVIPLEVAALDLWAMRTRFLRQGSLPEAVYASCAVPLLFRPMRIDGRLYLDGGILNKSAIRTTAGHERILSVYLETGGAAGGYELRRSVSALAPGTRMLRLRGLPQVGPNSLANGAAAAEAGYRLARQGLASALCGQVAEAASGCLNGANGSGKAQEAPGRVYTKSN
jgi:NTE family protein